MTSILNFIDDTKKRIAGEQVRATEREYESGDDEINDRVDKRYKFQLNSLDIHPAYQILPSSRQEIERRQNERKNQTESKAEAWNRIPKITNDTFFTTKRIDDPNYYEKELIKLFVGMFFFGLFAILLYIGIRLFRKNYNPEGGGGGGGGNQQNGGQNGNNNTLQPGGGGLSEEDQQLRQEIREFGKTMALVAAGVVCLAILIGVITMVRGKLTSKKGIAKDLGKRVAMILESQKMTDKSTDADKLLKSFTLSNSRDEVLKKWVDFRANYGSQYDDVFKNAFTSERKRIEEQKKILSNREKGGDA